MPVQFTGIQGLRDLGLSQQFQPDQAAEETADNTGDTVTAIELLQKAVEGLPVPIGEKVAEHIGMTNEPAEGGA